LDPATLALLQESVMTDKESNKISTEERNDPKRETSRWTAFKERQILKQIIVFFFAWFANAVVYYGISFNMKNMSGNPYVNVFLLGLLDLPAELSGIYFSNR
jgi:OCT family organic cation transporter-like MFS transporter 4/5